MTRAVTATLVALGLLVGGPARGAEVDALLARLDESARSVETLAGEFTQVGRLKLFRQEVSSRGRFYFQRPRRVRWEYLAPDPSVMVIDGDKATLTTPGARPQTFDLARDATMRAVTEQIFLWLGAGSLSRSREQYQPAVAGTEAAPALVLTPKAGGMVARAFTRIELRFDKQLLLRGILLREPSGDEKEITFTKMERNGKLPPDAFKP